MRRKKNNQARKHKPGNQSFNLVVATSHGEGPVILGDAAPEDPEHTDREQRKERFKQGAINSPICALANMGTDHVLEDLADGEQQTSGGQID